MLNFKVLARWYEFSPVQMYSRTMPQRMLHVYDLNKYTLIHVRTERSCFLNRKYEQWFEVIYWRDPDLLLVDFPVHLVLLYFGEWQLCSLLKTMKCVDTTFDYIYEKLSIHFSTAILTLVFASSSSFSSYCNSPAGFPRRKSERTSFPSIPICSQRIKLLYS